MAAQFEFSALVHDFMILRVSGVSRLQIKIRIWVCDQVQLSFLE